MTTVERKISNLSKHDFGQDSTIFGRLDIILETVSDAKDANDDALMLAMSEKVIKYLPADKSVEKKKSKSNADLVLADTLHRIARHIKERVIQYKQFYSVAESIMATSPQQQPTSTVDTASIKAALVAAEKLSLHPSDHEEVHNVLRQISAAAHQLLFLMQSTVEIKDGEIKKLEKKNSVIQSELDRVKEKYGLHSRDSLSKEETENRAMRLDKKTAPIVVKLTALNREGLRYTGRADVRTKRTGGLDSWLKPFFCNEKFVNHLTDEEYDLAKQHPAVFKSFDATLYQTVRTAITRSRN